MRSVPPLQKAMILIAVSKYPAPYKDLPGALTSAARLAKWAREPVEARNYTVLEINDGDGRPVTVGRLKTEISAFLAGNIIDRLVVYFAGHGMVRSVADQFWLLSDANNEGINVQVFLDRLKFQGIGQHNPELSQGQLCVIADACRSTGRDAVDFQGDPILRKQGAKQNLQVDLFLATSLTDQAFHINAGSGSSDPFCLFSAILSDALEGRVPAVIEKYHHPFKPVIVNNLLADYLQEEVPDRAAKLSLDMDPDISTGIRMKYNYYDILSGEAPGAEADPGDAMEAASISAMSLEPESWSTEQVVGDLRKVAQEKQTRTFEKALGMAEKLLWQIPNGHQVNWQEGADMCAVTEDVRAIAIPAGAFNGVRIEGSYLAYVPDRRWWNLPLFVKQDDRWLLVPLVDFTASVALGSMPGDVLLRRAEPAGPEPNRWWDTSLSSQAAFTTIPPLKVSDALHFADSIRFGKARMPNNANIAGYLYRFAGDDQNIQRTAHYMADSSILPIDLALLAASRLRWSTDENGVGCVRAELPAVPKGEDEIGSRPDYAKRAFDPKENVQIRGILPIYRQGWTMLEEQDHLEIPHVLRKLSGRPAGRAAVVLPEDAMSKLAKTLGYEIHHL